MNEKLTCEEVVGRLLDFLDRELDDEVEHEIEKHLEACRGCFTRAEFERRLKAQVAEAGDATAPETLRRRIRLMLDAF